MSKHSRRRVLAEMYGDRCFYCGCEFTETGSRQRTLDHMVPLSRFPVAVMVRHKPMNRKWRLTSKSAARALWNLALCCNGCNNAKGDLIWYEYYQTDTYWKRREAVRAEKVSKKPRVLQELAVPSNGTAA